MKVSASGYLSEEEVPLNTKPNAQEVNSVLRTLDKLEVVERGIYISHLSPELIKEVSKNIDFFKPKTPNKYKASAIAVEEDFDALWAEEGIPQGIS